MVEIKSASSYNKEFAKNLKKICAFAPNAFSPTVVYGGDLEIESDGVKYMNYKNCGNLV